MAWSSALFLISAESGRNEALHAFEAQIVTIEDDPELLCLKMGIRNGFAEMAGGLGRTWRSIQQKTVNLIVQRQRFSDIVLRKSDSSKAIQLSSGELLLSSIHKVVKLTYCEFTMSEINQR